MLGGLEGVLNFGPGANISNVDGWCGFAVRERWGYTPESAECQQQMYDGTVARLLLKALERIQASCMHC